MKVCFRIFLSFLVLTALSLGTVEAQSRKALKAEAKAERVKEKQKKAYLVSQKKDRKRRIEMQTPETKKRMKSTKKSANRYNDQAHEPFLKKLFH